MAWFEGRDEKRRRKQEKYAKHDPNMRARMDREKAAQTPAGYKDPVGFMDQFIKDQREAMGNPIPEEKPGGGTGGGEAGIPGETEEQLIARLAREADQMAGDADKRDRDAEEAGYREGEDFLNRDVRGMSPEERGRIESNAQIRLNKSLQGPQRDVLASQGKSGIRGGSAYAQQRDIQNLAREAEREFYRDMEEEDMNRKLRNQGFIYASGKGRAATSGLNRSQAQREIEMRDERNRNRKDQDYARNAFGRI